MDKPVDTILTAVDKWINCEKIGDKLVTSGSLERRTPTRGIRSGGRARMWTGW